MPNASGFVDFQQYSDLNRDEETRLLEQAMERAQAADAEAKRALGRTRNEADGSYGPDGQITGEVDQLSKSASYSDYLSAKGNAEAAWAAVTAQSRNPYSQALRGQVRAERGMGAAAGAAAAGRQGREAEAGDYVAVNAASQGRQRIGAAEAAEAKRVAKEKADADWKQNQAAYLAKFIEGSKGRAAAGGAQRDYVGDYNPYASSPWAQQMGGWEAQQIKNAGGGVAQQQGAWDAYTRKGSQGSAGNGRPNRYDSMNREMAPWAPPEEDED